MVKIGAMTSLYNIDPYSGRTKCISVEKITVYFTISSFNSDEHEEKKKRKKKANGGGNSKNHISNGRD